MVESDDSPAVAQLAGLVEGLGLRALGYRLTFSEAPGGWVTVSLGHPLLLQDEWSLTHNVNKPGWEEWVRERILLSPDVALVGEASVLRPGSIATVAALRHGAHAGCLRYRESEDAIASALLAISSAALSLLAASVLTEDESDWLLSALEADQDR